MGRSYEKACRNVGGSFIEFTESAGISLNPFSFVEDIDEDMELLQPLLNLIHQGWGEYWQIVFGPLLVLVALYAGGGIDSLLGRHRD